MLILEGLLFITTMLTELDLNIKSMSSGSPIEEEDMFPGGNNLYDEEDRKKRDYFSVKGAAENAGWGSSSGNEENGGLFKKQKGDEQVPILVNAEGWNNAVYGSYNQVEPVMGANFPVGTNRYQSFPNYPYRAFDNPSNNMHFADQIQTSFILEEKKKMRMIKNRESAARSRARKQAYQTQLQLEVNYIKDENEVLYRTYNNLVTFAEMKIKPTGNKLARTLSSPF